MITVYSRPQCSQCTQTKKWLEEHYVEYKEINIDHFDEVVRNLVEAGFRLLPVVTDGNTAISGYHPEELEEMIARQAQNQAKE